MAADRGDPTLDIQPLTADRWDDLERLFGPNGADGGCWCMWFRVSAAEFRARGGAGLHDDFQALVGEGTVPGLLAYRDGEPVGWVSLGRREEFGRIERSRQLRRVDDRPVWSIVCFFIDRRHRGTGVATALLGAARRHAADHGATLLEAYPVDDQQRRRSDAESYTGTRTMFERDGWGVVADAGRRVIVRRRP